MLQQRRRERAVAAVAVKCGFPLIGGIGNEGVWTRRFDTDQATSDTPQGKRTLHLLGKGIVAAGIEDDEAQLGCGLLGKQESGERYRLVVNIEIAFERGVDRDRIIGAGNLEAMTGEIDHRDVGPSRL